MGRVAQRAVYCAAQLAVKFFDAKGTANETGYNAFQN